MKSNLVSEKMVGWAQIGIALILVLSFVGILIANMFVPTPANQPASTTANVNSMLTVLGTLTTLGVQFFLARQRTSPTDPNPPTTGAPGNGKTPNPPGPGTLSGTNSGAPI